MYLKNVSQNFKLIAKGTALLSDCLFYCPISGVQSRAVCNNYTNLNLTCIFPIVNKIVSLRLNRMPGHLHRDLISTIKIWYSKIMREKRSMRECNLYLSNTISE